ncbi:hypothetical protein [Castellaniella sp. S9]|uniref:hypothetical protein n=1 Tax=Castellaniella sp. S9 TaxID=2993652 RepID=UPI0022B2FC4A|nr:hypothetical protein [Castellaniella sp. S9]
MATLDTRIPMSFQSPQINTPNQNRLQALAIQGQEMDIAQRGRALEQQNALAALFQRPGTFDSQGGINPTILPEVARVAPGQAMDFSKTIQGQRKAISDAQKAQLDQAKTQIDLVGRLLGSVTDENSFQAARQQALQLGIPLTGVPDRYDPAWVDQQRRQTLTYQQQLDNQFRASQASEKQGAPIGAPIEVTGPNGVPMLVQRYGDGSLRPVQGFSPKAREGLSITTNPDGTVSVTTGGAKSGKLTEQQSKDLVYLTRGEAASPILDKLGSQLADPAQRAGGAIPLVGNFTVSPDFQRADQAGREFLAAILRKDTGAAITSQEFDIYGKMYLPQPGDSPEVLAQKRTSRRTALDAIRSGLGAAAEGAPPRSNETQATDRDAQLDQILGF